MLNKASKRTAKITDLISRDEVNVRETNNYDLETMCEQIVQQGKIVSPITCEETPDGPLVLRGNRRTRAGQLLVADPNKISSILLRIADQERDSTKAAAMKATLAEDTAAILDGLNKVDIHVYKDLSEEERMMLVMDHGSEKPISRAEITTCVWRMDKSFFSESDIIRLCYYALAKFTGNERKLMEVPTEPKAREAMLRKWLHGTVGNFLLAANRMGEYVRQQFFLTRRDEDNLLGPDEKVEMRCNRDRIEQLSKAKNEEKDTWEAPGSKFNELIEKFKGEDSGKVAKEDKTRPSSKELKDKAGSMQHPALKKLLLLAAGEKGDKVGGLANDDDQLVRDDRVLKLIAASWDELPEPQKEFAKHLLGDTPMKFSEFLKTIVVK